MHILIAPDSFKGSLSAKEICMAARQVKETYYDENLRITTIPLADGGEGTLDCLTAAGATIHRCKVSDPLGRRVEAVWGELEEGIGVVEMAQASGLTHMKPDEYNPMKASTYGTGELIMEAIRYGCRSIYVTIGGSGTCDGGLGMLEAMGASLRDGNGQPIQGNGEGLTTLASIDLKAIYKMTEGITFRVAMDVENPLLGPNGAIHTYGPQKGATIEMVKALEMGMVNYRNLMQASIGIDLNHYLGGGAAGGVGATLMGVFGAIPEHGADFIMAHSGLYKQLDMKDVDWIITGEGRCDDQTMHGKLPYRVLLEGLKRDIPVIIIAGALGDGYDKLLDAGATAVLSIASGPEPLESALLKTRKNLERCYRNVFNIWMKASKQ